MISRYGVSGSEFDSVFFTDAATIPGGRDLGEVRVTVGGQNKDLRHVKAQLAKEVRRKGGDALTNFQYGQRGNPWWQSFGTFDSEHWYGSGRAVIAGHADRDTG